MQRDSEDVLMVQVQLEPEIEQKVREAAQEQRISESFLIGEVLKRWFEDRLDYAAGMRALSEMKYTISLDELERRSNVAD